MSYTQGAMTIQPLDVAMLRDTGLPILSDREIQEHIATRLYQAALGRAPDGPGLLNATRVLLAGTSLSSVANGFVTSQEFANRFGTSLSNTAFVDALYKNVLNRSGEASGVQHWVNTLGRGVSRADALIGFADSLENRNALSVNPNLSYGATAEAQMERLYDTAFGRAPDPAGFRQWTQALINGATLPQVAMGFMTSPEFTNRYGSAPANEALVNAFYQNTLRRAADAGGRASWLDALNNGLSRADMMTGFSESVEHQRNVIAQDTAVSGGFLVDTSAHLGSIPVLPVIRTA